METEGYSTVRIRVERGVAFATIDLGELRPFVHELATRIASFPAEAVAHAKASVAAAERDPVPGLLQEGHGFNQTLALDETVARMEGFLAAGGQTREFELELNFDRPDLANGG